MDPRSRRRTLLAIGGAAVATLSGCLTGNRSGDGRDPGTWTETTTTSREPTATAGGQRPVATVEWTATDLAGPAASLTVPDRSAVAGTGRGALYVATDASEVARIATAGGTVEWIHGSSGDGGDSHHPSVSRHDGTVYAVSQTWTDDTLRNYVEAVAPDTGGRRWTFSAREFLTTLGVVDGTLAVAGRFIEAPPSELGPNQSARGDGSLHGIDVEDGTERWTVDVPGIVGGDVGQHGIYVLEEPPTDRSTEPATTVLHGYDRDGDRRWTVDTGTRGLPAPRVADDAVLAGADGGVGRYEPATGAVEWTVGKWDRGPSEITAAGGGIFYAGSNPLISFTLEGDVRFEDEDGGRVVRPAGTGSLYLWDGVSVQAVDPASGDREWIYRPEDANYTYPRAVVDAGVLVNDGPTPEGAFRLLGRESGAVLGAFETPADHHDAVGLRDLVVVARTDGVFAYRIDP